MISGKQSSSQPFVSAFLFFNGVTPKSFWKNIKERCVSYMSRDTYESPLSARYADKEMKYSGLPWRNPRWSWACR